jgi:autotransporter-associated beta strand protein
MSPATGDWNQAANWMPPTIPNGPLDTATFASSNRRGVSVSADTEVNGIAFNSGASAFTITARPSFRLTISGVGITNNSGSIENFVTADDGLGHLSVIYFTNSATVGDLTAFTNRGGTANLVQGGIIQFLQSSTAGHGTFTNNGGEAAGASGGSTLFRDSATAGNGNFTNNDGTIFPTSGGYTIFVGRSTAANGTFTNNGGISVEGGSTDFAEMSNAGNGVFTNNGGAVGGAVGGYTIFTDRSTAANATLIANGSPNGGEGGSIWFFDKSRGDTARVELFGNGNLDISAYLAPRGVTIGSIEGDGDVFLGAMNLSVGSNSLSTVFSGVIQDGGIVGGTGGSLAKIGTGKLVLSHRNTYTGGTTIKRGKLMVNNEGGSGTGSGPVQVEGGWLGGKGIIAGTVTVGTGSGSGAVLAPGYVHGLGSPGALTIQSPLTFSADATYKWT